MLEKHLTRVRKHVPGVGKQVAGKTSRKSGNNLGGQESQIMRYPSQYLSQVPRSCSSQVRNLMSCSSQVRNLRSMMFSGQESQVMQFTGQESQVMQFTGQESQVVQFSRQKFLGYAVLRIDIPGHAWSTQVRYCLDKTGLGHKLQRVGGRVGLRCRRVQGGGGAVLTYWWSPNRVGGRAGPSLVHRGRDNADPRYLGQNPLLQPVYEQYGFKK